MGDDAAERSVNAPMDEETESSIAKEFDGGRVVGAAGMRFRGSIEILRKQWKARRQGRGIGPNGTSLHIIAELGPGLTQKSGTGEE